MLTVVLRMVDDDDDADEDDADEGGENAEIEVGLFALVVPLLLVYLWK